MFALPGRWARWPNKQLPTLGNALGRPARRSVEALLIAASVADTARARAVDRTMPVQCELLLRGRTTTDR